LSLRNQNSSDGNRGSDGAGRTEARRFLTERNAAAVF
jgi:hypothetical protein